MHDQRYQDSGIFREALRAYPDQAEFAQWLANAAPYGGVDIGHAYTDWLRTQAKPTGAEIRLIGWDGKVDILPAPSAVRAVARAESFLTSGNLPKFMEVRVYGGPERRRMVGRWQHGTTGWIATA